MSDGPEIEIHVVHPDGNRGIHRLGRDWDWHVDQLTRDAVPGDPEWDHLFPHLVVTGHRYIVTTRIWR